MHDTIYVWQNPPRENCFFENSAIESFYSECFPDFSVASPIAKQILHIIFNQVDHGRSTRRNNKIVLLKEVAYLKKSDQ